jgi:hypothetical protein
LQWGATDRDLVDALAGFGIDIAQAAPDAEEPFLAVLGDLLYPALTALTSGAWTGLGQFLNPPALLRAQPPNRGTDLVGSLRQGKP